MTILRTFSIMTLVIALTALVGCGGQQADSEDAMMEGDDMEVEGHDMEAMEDEAMEEEAMEEEG